MGLTKWTATTSGSNKVYSIPITDSNVALYSGATGMTTAPKNDGYQCFVANISVWDGSNHQTLGLYRSSRTMLTADAAGVKNMTITLNGFTSRNGTATGSWTGPIQYQVTTSSTRPTSGWTNFTPPTSYQESITLTTIAADIPSNQTRYLWIQYQVNAGFCWGWGRLGMVLTCSEPYGTPGDVTASDGYFGDAMSISYASATSGATYDVYTTTTVESGGNNGSTQYVEWLQQGGSGSSLNWTPALATYAPKLLNRSSTTCTITVNTYFGGALAGTKQKTITLSFDPADVGPTLATGCFGCEAVNPWVSQQITGYVQNYSKVQANFDISKVTLPAYGGSSADVKEWRVKFGTAQEVTVAKTTSSYQSDTVTGSLTVTCTLVDSRGLTASTDISVTVMQYAPPVFEAGTLYYRCADSSDTEDDNGHRLVIKPVVSFSSLNNQNSITLAFYWRIVNTPSWTNKTNDASPSLANNTKSFFTSFSDNNYELLLTVKDTLQTITQQNAIEWKRSVPSSLHFLTSTTGWDGAAFGKVANYSGELDIGTWDLRCNNIIINNEDLGALLAQIKAALNIS